MYKNGESHAATVWQIVTILSHFKIPIFTVHPLCFAFCDVIMLILCVINN